MQTRRDFGWIVAAMLAAVGLVSGCEESEQRVADKQLADHTQQAQALYEDARLLMAHRMRDPQVVGQRGEAGLDEAARRAVGEWIRKVEGRESVLVNEQDFQTALERWARCRELINLVARGDIEAADELARKRAGDLLPTPPEPAEIREMDDDDPYVAVEARKARVVKRLQKPEAWERIHAALLNGLAADAVAAWIADGPDRAVLLTGDVEAAGAELTRRAREDETAQQILAKARTVAVDANVTRQLHAAIRQQVASAETAADVVRRVRAGEAVSLPVPYGASAEVRQKLTEAEGLLTQALSGQAKANPPRQKIARQVLAQVKQAQGDYYAAVADGLYGRANDAREMGGAQLALLNAQLDRVRRARQHAALTTEDIYERLAEAEDGDIAALAAGQEAKRAEYDSKVKALKKRIEGKEAQHESLRNRAVQLDDQAGQAYALSRSGDTREVREENLEKFVELQKQADQAARQAETLYLEIRKDKLSLAVAEVDRDEADARLAALRADMKTVESWKAEKAGELERAALDLRRTRAQTAMLLSTMADSLSRADEAWSNGSAAYDAAAEEYARADGPGNKPQVATALVCQADVLTRRAEMHQATMALAADVLAAWARNPVLRSGTEVGAQADRIVRETVEALNKMRTPATSPASGMEEVVPVDELMAEAQKLLAEKVEAAWQIPMTGDASMSPVPPVVFAELVAGLADVLALRDQADAKGAEAADVCEEAINLTRTPVARNRVLDAMAAAYLTRLSATADPAAHERISRQARSSAIAEYLREAPKAEEERMYAMDRLRVRLGLKPAYTVEKPEVETPATQPGEPTGPGGPAEPGGLEEPAPGGEPPMEDA